MSSIPIKITRIFGQVLNEATAQSLIDAVYQIGALPNDSVAMLKSFLENSVFSDEGSDLIRSEINMLVDSLGPQCHK